MARKSRSPPKEILTFPVRAPKDLVEAFDKAIELGFINARSRNEAIIKLIESFLNDIFFVVQAFDEAKKLAKSPKYRNSGLPPELLHIQLALELIDPLKNPNAENITTRYQNMVGTALARSMDPKLAELEAQLDEIFNHGGDEENE